VRNLALLNADIDVLALCTHHENCNPEEMMQKWQIKNITIIRRSLPQHTLPKALYYLKQFLFSPTSPLTISSFCQPLLQTQIREYLTTDRWDYLVLDGLHNAGVLLQGNELYRPPNVGKIIYRAHNIERDLWLRSAEQQTNLLARKFLQYQAGKMEAFEKLVLRSADLIAAISTEDELEIAKISPDTKTILIPPGLDFHTELNPIPTENPPHFILFLGRMDWPPNRDGLRWFLEQVWPEITPQRDDLHLLIAGVGNHNWLKKYLPIKNATFLGFVDSVTPLYAKVIATIIPVFYGSGTRIKVIESIRFQRPCISTDLGMQGSTLSPDLYLQANNQREWIDTLLSLQPSLLPQIAHKAFLCLQQTYDERKVAQKFLDQLTL
jgi:hypothetical protein